MNSKSETGSSTKKFFQGVDLDVVLDQSSGESNLEVRDRTLTEAAHNLSRNALLGESGDLRPVLAYLENASKTQVEQEAFELGRRIWEYEVEFGAGPEDLVAICKWASHFEVDDRTFFKLGNRISWITRGGSTVLPLIEDLPSEVSTGRAARMFVRIHLDRARFSFKPRNMMTVVATAVGSWDLGDNPYVIGSEAFALLADSKIDHGMQRVRSAWDHDSHDPAVQDVCLHALWMSEANEEASKQCVEWATWMEKSGYSTPVSHYRLASAYRRLGSYNQAIASVDIAIRSLSGNGEFYETFSEQLIRERSNILVASELTQRERELNVAIREATQNFERVESSLRRSTLTSIEILGLFTASIAFFIGSTQVAISVDSMAHAFAITLGLACGLVLFALAIHLVGRSLGRQTISGE